VCNTHIDTQHYTIIIQLVVHYWIKIRALWCLVLFLPRDACVARVRWIYNQSSLCLVVKFMNWQSDCRFLGEKSAWLSCRVFLTRDGRPNRFQVGIAEPEVGRLGPSTTTRAEGKRKREKGKKGGSHRLKSRERERDISSRQSLQKEVTQLLQRENAN